VLFALCTFPDILIAFFSPKSKPPEGGWLINIPTADCIQYIGVGLGGFLA